MFCRGQPNQPRGAAGWLYSDLLDHKELMGIQVGHGRICLYQQEQGQQWELRPSHLADHSVVGLLNCQLWEVQVQNILCHLHLWVLSHSQWSRLCLQSLPRLQLLNLLHQSWELSLIRQVQNLSVRVLSLGVNTEVPKQHSVGHKKLPRLLRRLLNLFDLWRRLCPKQQRPIMPEMQCKQLSAMSQWLYWQV